MQRAQCVEGRCKSNIYIPTAASSAMIGKLASLESKGSDIRLVHTHLIECRVREKIGNLGGAAH